MCGRSALNFFFRLIDTPVLGADLDFYFRRITGLADQQQIGSPTIDFKLGDHLG